MNDMRNPMRPLLRSVPFLPEVPISSSKDRQQHLSSGSLGSRTLLKSKFGGALACFMPVDMGHYVMQHFDLAGMAQAWTHRRKVARVQRQLLGMLHSLAREVCSRCASHAHHC